jgi:hypothetical protein
VDRDVLVNPCSPKLIPKESITGIVGVGAGVGWDNAIVQARLSDLL